MDVEEYPIISRAKAKAIGLKYYFTGKPCKNGALLRRVTSTGLCLCDKCLSDQRERQRRHYAKNKAAGADRSRRYRKNNPAKSQASSRSYYEKNRDAISDARKINYEANKVDLAEKNRRYRDNNANAIAEKRLAHYAANKEAINARRRKYLSDNKQKLTESQQIYYEKNKEVLAGKRRQYRADNPGVMQAIRAKRRLAVRESMPIWFGEMDAFALQEAFSLSRERSVATGILWHVDHRIPLRSPSASGLHCADNIQVIPARMNLVKRNRMILTEPLEWIKAL